MECINLEHPILEYHSDTLWIIRKMYGYDTQERIEEAIDILENWIKKQSHFIKKDFPRRYLEFTIVSCKGSIERAKDHMDKILTHRTLIPHFFGDFDIKTEFKALSLSRHALLPKLTKTHNRVVLLKTSANKFDSKYILQVFRLTIMYIEHVKMNEYCDGFVFVFDFSEANMTELMKSINLIDLRNGLTVVLQAYGLRVLGVHFLSSSRVMDVFVKFLLPLLSPKIADRIHVHKSIETIYDYIPKDILPLEYGGKERSYHKLYEEWVDVFSSEEIRKQQKEMSEARTDESLRQKDTFNDKYLGLSGSFKVLTVD